MPAMQPAVPPATQANSMDVAKTSTELPATQSQRKRPAATDISMLGMDSQMDELVEDFWGTADQELDGGDAIVCAGLGILAQPVH